MGIKMKRPRLLDAPANAGITLADAFAMLPTAAVSGFYLAHPEARYFAVGKVERDQVADYAHRKGMDLAQVERWNILAATCGGRIHNALLK